MLLRKLALAALLAVSASAQAAPVFSDNFSADSLALNKASWLQGWTVSLGTVDLIGAGFHDFIPANGKYVDLDGSSSKGGVFAKTLMLTAGQNYKLTFDLAGNQRGSAADTVQVMFGTAAAAFGRVSSAAFGTESLLFTPGVTGMYSISFDDLGGDNMGALLDNVSVTSVPEPGVLALMLAGFAGIGALTRRKQR